MVENQTENRKRQEMVLCSKMNMVEQEAANDDGMQRMPIGRRRANEEAGKEVE